MPPRRAEGVKIIELKYFPKSLMAAGCKRSCSGQCQQQQKLDTSGEAVSKAFLLMKNS